MFMTGYPVTTRIHLKNSLLDNFNKLYDVLYVKSCVKIWFPLMFERVTWYNAFRYDFNPERSNANYTGTHYTVIIRFFFNAYYTHMLDFWKHFHCSGSFDTKRWFYV